MCNSDCWYKEVCSNFGDDCEKCCGRYAEMKFLMEHSGIPKNKQKPIALTPFEVDYKAFSRLAEIKEDMTAFVDSGKNLYITSAVVGNGKTSWALKLLMKYFDEVWDGNGFRVRGRSRPWQRPFSILPKR